MSLKDGDARVRITFKDYSFFMPTSLPEGTIVVIKGVLSASKLSEAQVAHLESEGAMVPNSGEELKVVAEGALVEYRNR